MARAGRAPTRHDEAWRLFRQGRELLCAALLIHQQPEIGTAANSAPLALKAIRLLLLSVVRAESDDDVAPEVVVERVGELNRDQQIFRYRLDEELGWLEELASGFSDLTDATSSEDRTRYARLLKRAPQVFADVERHLRRHAPGRPAARRRRLLAVAGVALAAIVALVVWRVSRTEPTEQCLPGSYFSDRAFTELAFERCDRAVDFDWDMESPGGGVKPDGFSVRWQGTLTVPRAGLYTFFLRSDDGSRLYVGDKLVVDNWGEHAALVKAGKIQLDPGQTPLRVDFFDDVEAASVRLSWRVPGEKRAVISSQYLSP